jgi:PEP-CTERM motif
MSKIFAIAALAAATLLSPAYATTYVSDPAFTGAAGGGLTFEGFESAPTASTPTSVTFGPVTASCTASAFCPGFFGTRTGFASEGVTTIFFATPSSMVFTFNSTITHFGVDVIGAGTAGATDIVLSYDGPNGSTTVLYPALVGGSFDVNFAGLIDLAGFTTVTFSGTNNGDGIDFDRLRFKSAAAPAVPEPATWAMLVAGFGVAGALMRRRTRLLRTA